MMMMGKGSFSVLLLCFGGCSCSLSAGYVPSTDPAQRKLLQRPKLQTVEVTKVKGPTTTTKTNRVRLDSIFQTNPLEKFHQQQHQRRIKNQNDEVIVEVEPLMVEVEDVDEEEDPVPTVHIPDGPVFNGPNTAVTHYEDDDLQRGREKEEGRQALFESASAFLAGFTDVLCLAQYGCFVNMMTGTLLKMTTAMANFQTVEALVHALFVGSYMAGVSLFDWVKTSNDDDDKAALRWVAPIVLALFATADCVARQWAGPKLLQVPFLAMGFGVINTAASHATGNTIFFAMTGHLTKLTTGLRNTKQQADNAVMARSKSILRHFLMGGLVAAVLSRERLFLSSAVMLPPLCTSLGLLYAALFAWYAPITGVIPRAVALGSTLSRKLRRALGLGAIGRDTIAGQPELIPVPVFVDVLPTPTTSNYTFSGY
ncbi:expressed unknown protein [Seminavis robusta]|uniref:Uncharacterized protein n=1 Tax=Seminavis robusta TaxID=568900 RepID=A0A9N8DM85_9STRA|nr:expressed unknown protein [Seminavis robusta]|eukprot:Sro158_g071590.1 n/a (426) ;mRNA; f:50782-52059